MVATHLEFLVEEPSMEAFLREILPKVVGENVTFTIHVHQGKQHLLRKLSERLRGYSLGTNGYSYFCPAGSRRR